MKMIFLSMSGFPGMSHYILHLVALVTTIMATTNFDETQFAKLTPGEKSGTHVGDESHVGCPRGYLLSECMCGPSSNCDGSWVRHINKGDLCVAFNKVKADGVKAYALCEQLLVDIETEMVDAPSIKCPDHYTLISCMMHTYYTYKWPDAEGIVEGETCTTTPDCKLCRVQARCLRTQKFTSHTMKKRSTRNWKMDNVKNQ